MISSKRVTLSTQVSTIFTGRITSPDDVVKIQVNGESTLETIMEKLFHTETIIDGIVTDFLLDEEGDVEFNGNAIVAAIKDYKPHFPITMLTAHESEAISYMDDVHIIYDKYVLDEGNEEKLKSLKAKIKTNIQRYYSKIESTEKRIEQLVKKRNEGNFEPQDETELTKLFILMAEYDPEGNNLPVNIIQSESITKLNDFVTETKEILEELKKNKNK